MTWRATITTAIETDHRPLRTIARAVVDFGCPHTPESVRVAICNYLAGRRPLPTTMAEPLCEVLGLALKSSQPSEADNSPAA